jgi:hypothetical protein
MKKALVLEFLVIFVITFTVASIVSTIWNYLSEGVFSCNWEIAAQFAILFGILCPLIDAIRSDNKELNNEDG